jgi:hypothetical protein
LDTAVLVKLADVEDGVLRERLLDIVLT